MAHLKSDTSVQASFSYQYDKAGNRTSLSEADGSRTTWSYDAAYQLTGEHRTGANAFRNTFTYRSFAATNEWVRMSALDPVNGERRDAQFSQAA